MLGVRFAHSRLKPLPQVHRGSCGGVIGGAFILETWNRFMLGVRFAHSRLKPLPRDLRHICGSGFSRECQTLR